MIVIVVDASVLVTALIDDGKDGDQARAEIYGQTLAAPELIDLEVLSVIRRLAQAGSLPTRRAELAVQDLKDLAIQRARHTALVGRCWELRDNLTSYDAAYVALAEALGAPLVTGDSRIASSPGVRCQIRLLG